MTDFISPDELTKDGFLDNGFFVYQPAKGAHRSGMDAILLAAMVPKDFSGNLADFGAGCGVAGMATAHRCSAAKIDLIEIDEFSCDLAKKSSNLENNRHLKGRIDVICADLIKIKPETAIYDHVIANPPFNGPSRQASSSGDKARAHVMDKNLLNEWSKAAVRMTKPKGEFSLILRSENLNEILEALKGRFGSVKIVPVHSKPDAPANRILVQATKGAKAPLKLLPPLILHYADGAFTKEAESIFRGRNGVPHLL